MVIKRFLIEFTLVTYLAHLILLIWLYEIIFQKGPIVMESKPSITFKTYDS